jgi:polar amino acid transport system substrate-binding protein
MSKTAKIVIGILAAIAIIAIIAIVIIVLTGPSEPEPTAVPPTTAPTTPPEAGDDSWDRIEAAGKMVVGTSADYPPFEFYVSDMQIDGFDIAMMDEMGRRLGVSIEYLDYAFDGLGPALQLGQIDLALAAVSVTSERESVVDFSNVYLVGEDAILAKKGSGITISSVDDMAAYRVGVQRNTVYEAWVRTELIDTGKMPESNLFIYELATHAFRDLTEGRIDLMMLDASPAELVVQTEDVEIVGQGLNQQRYAIALPKGAAALKEKIDGVLLELHNEGVIASLAQKYLGQEVLLPTPTPGPTSTPKPPSECLDGLSFVEHPNGDGSSSKPIQVAPGQKFTKVWKVLNSGTCTWDSSYQLVFVSGNRMGGQPTPVQGTVAPGQSYDIAVDMTAPLYAGDYSAIWNMENTDGIAFGQRLRVYVKVVPGPTATPAPTQTPTAGIVFTADRNQINYGECVNFYWKVENVKEVYFYHEGEDWRDNGVTGEGTSTECPPATLNYYLRVVLRDGSVSTSKITIYVTSQPDAPYIQRFTADPPNLVTLGQSVLLQWEVFNQVNKLTLSANDVILWEGAPVKGQYRDTPASSGSVSYLLVAEGDGGTSQSRINLNVVDPATATAVPTSAPEQPVIYSFSVSPNSIADGDCVDINWSAGGGASDVEVLRDGTVIVPDAPFSGHANDCPTPDGTYTYQLAASNSAGETVTQQRTVQVSATAPENPLANTFWTVANYWDGTTMQTVLPGTLLTTNFDSSGGVSGSGGCNTYSATYDVSGSSLTISSPLATGKLCDADIDAQEQAFFAAMESAATFNIEAGQLYIMNSSGAAVLEYIATGP